MTLEMTKDIISQKVNSFNKQASKLKEDCTAQIDKMVREHESQMAYTIDRVSQRYEEYLKRIIPLLKDLRFIRNTIHDNFSTISRQDIITRLSSIEEDIDDVLKILNIIDGERGRNS